MQSSHLALRKFAFELGKEANIIKLEFVATFALQSLQMLSFAVPYYAGSDWDATSANWAAAILSFLSGGYFTNGEAINAFYVLLPISVAWQLILMAVCATSGKAEAEFPSCP